VAKEITEAYAALGPDPYVAVRSSGTAEDMADASFAGLHDTFLDVKGADSVIDAVKDCWASLWTARATAYRKARGFDHLAVSLPVVVQMMAEADVAGVMFTANPLTAATNEIVINASWGLGESVVSGAVTPDEFVIDTDTLRVKRRILGSKARETVRNPQSGRGTLTREVDEDRRSAYSLTDDQLNALARLGRRITRHYREVPQDIEWALVDGLTTSGTAPPHRCITQSALMNSCAPSATSGTIWERRTCSGSECSNTGAAGPTTTPSWTRLTLKISPHHR
jgi:pyruvate,water dikinase